MSDRQPTATLAFENGRLLLIDQTRLPGELTTFECTSVVHVHDAIYRLVVRGAPAIGVAAAYGVCLAEDNGRESYLKAADYLATSRPTAVNLFWALQRMRDVIERTEEADLKDALLAEATLIHDEDLQMCRDLGEHGANLLRKCSRVLTHCNAGSLATSMWGTALAPIYHLHQEGHSLEVFADETRPLLQGARLTAWELSQAGIDVTVLTDSMAGGLMREGKIDAVIVGADRIAANGDVANKIGTYSLAVLAKHHDVPFYVVAPSSTFDLALESGDAIPIEERPREEVSVSNGRTMVPDAAKVMNPAFDVTPSELVAAIVTERGIVERPSTSKLAEHLR